MKKRDIVLLGFTIPDAVANQYFKVDPSPAIQTHRFAWSLLRSLSFNNNVTLISSVPVQNYPLVNKLFFPGGRFKIKNTSGYYVSFVNVLILKHITRFFSCGAIFFYIYFKKKPKVVFIHGLHLPYLALIIVCDLLNIKTILVLTDPAGVDVSTDSFFSKMLKKIDKNISYFFINKADALIALAPKLIDTVSDKALKIIFPGFLNNDFLDLININLKNKNYNLSNNNEFKIVYAGSLREAYGVKILIDAILSFDSNKKITMLFVGKGDLLKYIEKTSSLNSRIKYGGFLQGEELVRHLIDADLLINPRPTDLDFSSLSFPSKLIEYLATGTPVLTTRISSIPSNYAEHFYYIDKEDAAGVKDAIISVMNIDVVERYNKGFNAKVFIENNASEFFLSEKIETLTLNTLYE